ncbi:Uncharacterized protein PCOAH_00015730 [Plasmodium coatneyi]|uniref:Uncharacterized protein n=1 Tax=Plasmodium coatneyi TaxID=208452 RepID=A0A1B1DXU2_9APIC|nr:Uncharacterized protein PCOAH_00015730 [Plasmodium coatneyi]ANQ07449.1 Uncharacterized protein PCOAH_00015730 [Plasmodium coatneyi]
MKKLRCEGIFTHREYDVVTDQPPYYIIYKKSSGGVYEASEHFNGLTALIKGRRENYRKSKEKVMRHFLHKVYQHRGRKAFHPGSTTKERHIVQLMKNANPLYVRSDTLEHTYRGCSFPLSHFPKGGLLKVNKHCLSHNYVLLDWDDESRLEGGHPHHPHEGKPLEWKSKTSSLNREKDPPHVGGEDIWGIIYLSRVDLLETNFEDHLKELYHERLRRKDKRVAVLLSFLLHHRVVRNLCVKSMTVMKVEKGVSSGENHRQKDELKRGLTKEVFTVSLEMHARNNNCVDHLSFLLDKFHCEDVKGGTFFTNSFLNKTIYAHSRRLKEEVRYENVTYVEGLKRGVFLLSYLFSQMGRADRLINSNTSYEKARRSYTIGVEDRVVYMPTLFRDHLYLASDYVMYKEGANQLVCQRKVANLIIEKEFKGEGMKRDCRVTVRVVCDEAAWDASILRNCSAIVLDLHPNGVVLDKERLAIPHMTASFADIETYKSVSPPAVTKYRVSLSQGGPSSGGFTLGGFATETLSPEKGQGDAPNVVTLPTTGEDTTTKGSSHQQCAAFSFDVQIGSRYFAPCDKGEQLKRSISKKGVHFTGVKTPPTSGDNTCTDYDAVMLSNAKVFLKCTDGEESSTTSHHRRNATLYADATHVYFNGGDDMLSVHTRDFFLFLSEVSFVQVLSPRRVDHAERGNAQQDNTQQDNVQPGNAQPSGGGPSRIGRKREEPPETLATYSLARTINSERIMSKRIIYNEVLKGDPPWQHVAAANDVEMLRWPPPNGDASEGGADYYVDVVYVYSVPRGADSYLYVLCVSALTSVVVVLCTFVLARSTGYPCDKLTRHAINRREIHVFFTHNRKEQGNLLNIKRYGQGRDNSKVVLLDVEKCEGEKMKKKIHKYLIGGVLLSSMCICLIEFDVVTSLYGYLLSCGLLAFYTFQLYSCNSVILRAVLDVKNRHLLLYPFTFMTTQGMKKQIIVSLHEIGPIRTRGNFIRIYFKEKNLLSFLVQHRMLSPLRIPRYPCAQTSEPAKEDVDVLYHYDYNNLNVSAFGQRGSGERPGVGHASSIGAASMGAASIGAASVGTTHVGTLPRVRKNAEGYPLNVREEAKLLSLLRPGGM